MTFDQRTLEEISDLICGDNGPYYRKGLELPVFFRNSGLYCPDFGNDSRKSWVLNQLEEYNKDSSIYKVLFRLANPKEYYDKEITMEVIKRLNDILALESLEIILDGIKPILATTEAYIPNQESDKNENIQLINFNKIVNDKTLCIILEKRWAEIELCLNVGAYLSTIILLGSMLEGVLVDIVEKNPKDANCSKAAPKDKSGKVLYFKNWTLNNLINVAHDCGWIDNDIKAFNSSLRDYRNLVHPSKQRDENIFPDEYTCNICLHVVYAALNDLEKIK